MFHGKCPFSHYLPERIFIFKIIDSQCGFSVKNLDKDNQLPTPLREVKTKKKH